MNVLASLFGRHRWFRKLASGKWELQHGRWVLVSDWTTPRERPDLYDGESPEREDWESVRT